MSASCFSPLMDLMLFFCSLDAFSNEMIPGICMLSLVMEHQVLVQRDDSFVVHIQRYCFGLATANVVQQTGKPNSLARRSGGGDVLSLTGRESHHSLLLRQPANRALAEEEAHACGTLLLYPANCDSQLIFNSNLLAIRMRERMFDFCILIVIFFFIIPVAGTGCVKGMTWESDEAKKAITCKKKYVHKDSSSFWIYRANPQKNDQHEGGQLDTSCLSYRVIRHDSQRALVVPYRKATHIDQMSVGM